MTVQDEKLYESKVRIESVLGYIPKGKVYRGKDWKSILLLDKRKELDVTKLIKEHEA